MKRGGGTQGKEKDSTHNRLEIQPLINQDIIFWLFRLLWSRRRVVKLNVLVAEETHLATVCCNVYVLEVDCMISCRFDG